jgi:hypothetical protein
MFHNFLYYGLLSLRRASPPAEHGTIGNPYVLGQAPLCTVRASLVHFFKYFD